MFYPKGSKSAEYKKTRILWFEPPFVRERVSTVHRLSIWAKFTHNYHYKTINLTMTILTVQYYVKTTNCDLLCIYILVYKLTMKKKYTYSTAFNLDRFRMESSHKANEHGKWSRFRHKMSSGVFWKNIPLRLEFT